MARHRQAASTWLFSALLGVGLVFLAACSDYVFAPQPSTDEAMAPADPWGPAEGSPWDEELADDTLPEEYFAVAWREVRNTEPEGETPKWELDDLRYDLLHVDGRLVRSFDLPFDTQDVMHLGLQPAGPGRFLINLRMPDFEPSESGAPYERRVFLADDASGEATEILRVDWTGHMLLPVADKEVDLGFHTSRLLVSADPLYPDRIFVLPDSVDAETGSSAAGIYSFDWRDPEATVGLWPPDEYLADGLFGADGEGDGLPWAFGAEWDGERTRFALGIDGFVDGVAERQRWFYTYAPSTGEQGWSLDLTDQGLRSEPSFLPEGDGSAGGTVLFQDGGASLACTAPEFVLLRQDAAMRVSGGDTIDCAWGGPLLHASPPTFAYHGLAFDRQAKDMGHVLVISHAGDDVWSIDRFQEGTARLRFLLQQAVRVEPLPD